jgi:hypothetical protein
MRLAVFRTPDGGRRAALKEPDAVTPLAGSLTDFLAAPGGSSVPVQPKLGARLPVGLPTVPPVQPLVVVAPGPRPDPALPEQAIRLAGHREFYLKSGHTVIGAEDAIPYRDALGALSYRAQLGLIFRPTDRHTPATAILDRLAGVVLAAEVYSVDLLRVGWEGTMWHVRYGEGASFDGACPIGPILVTADELLGAEVRLTDGAGDAAVEWADVAEFAAYVNEWMELGPSVLVLAGSRHGPVMTLEGADPVIRFPSGEPAIGLTDVVRVSSPALGNVAAPVGESLILAR